MKPFPIPVFAEHPFPEQDEGLDLLDMPSGMDTFALPRIESPRDPAARAEAVRVLDALVADLRALRFGEDILTHDLSALAPAVLAEINDALGQGEVAARVEGEAPLRVQETVFAGLWRVLGPGVDRVEACPIPTAIAAAARAAARDQVEAPPTRADLMNGQAVLAELLDAVRRHRPGGAAHIVNLTLLPMTPGDLEWLAEALGFGPATVLSRGYGNCRITSTGLAHTWWVQYFNNADRLILNTLEVTDMPDVAPAAAEDFGDSIERLAEWVGALRED